jgi:hypothetical protein
VKGQRIYLMSTSACGMDGDRQIEAKLAVQGDTPHDAMQRAGRATSRRWHAEHRHGYPTPMIGEVTVTCVGVYEVER